MSCKAEHNHKGDRCKENYSLEQIQKKFPELYAEIVSKKPELEARTIDARLAIALTHFSAIPLLQDTYLSEWVLPAWHDGFFEVYCYRNGYDYEALTTGQASIAIRTDDDAMVHAGQTEKLARHALQADPGLKDEEPEDAKPASLPIKKRASLDKKSTESIQIKKRRVFIESESEEETEGFDALVDTPSPKKATGRKSYNRRSLTHQAQKTKNFWSRDENEEEEF